MKTKKPCGEKIKEGTLEKIKEGTFNSRKSFEKLSKMADWSKTNWAEKIRLDFVGGSEKNIFAVPECFSHSPTFPRDENP